MLRRLILASVCLSGLFGCSNAMPANWARGGAPIDIPRARWVVGTSVVDVFPDGRINLNDNQQMTIDRGGRVWNTNNEPVALLEPSGNVDGPGDKPLGTVGVLHASRAGEQTAWLSVLPSGEVVQYADDGTRSSLGVWVGCNQSYQSHQTCTYLSHIMAPQIISSLQSYRSMYPYGYGMYPGGMMGPGMMGGGFWPYR